MRGLLHKTHWAAVGVLTVTSLYCTQPTLAAERMVFIEGFTSASCIHCPYAGVAFGELLDTHPETVTGLQYYSGVCSFGDQRRSFYSVSSVPYYWFDGVLNRLGAAPGTSYASEYAQRVAAPTDVTIHIGAGPAGAQTIDVNVTVCIEEGGTAKEMRVYLGSALDNYPASSGDKRNCLRYGETLGTINLQPGQCHTFTTTITFDSISWAHQDDIRLIAWAQEPATSGASGDAEVYQSAVEMWPFSALIVKVADSVPEFIDPHDDTNLTVQILNKGETYVPGTAELHFRYDDGEFITAPLLELGDDQFLATLPAPGCDAQPQFYFSATGHLGTTVYEPPTAPDEFFTTTVAEVTTIFEDDFNTDTGWTVESDPSLEDGEWERAIPSTDGSYGEATADYDGSGYCFVTQNTHQGDVDYGPTHVISPTVDMSGTNNPLLRFAYYFVCDDSGPLDQDFLVVSFSNNDGQDWTEAATYEAFDGWVQTDLAIADYLTPTNTMKVRFTTSDNPNNSKTEAAIDTIWFYDLSCGPAFCAGDLNCDGTVDFDDIDPFVAALGCPGGDPNCWDPACPWLNGDCNGDETVNFDDIDPFVARFGTDCP